MSYSDYTAPLFGTMDMQGFSVPYLSGTIQDIFSLRNRPDVIEKTSDGRIKHADVCIQYTTHQPSASQNFLSQNLLWQCKVNANAEACILAIPIYYGSYPNINEGSTYQYFAPLSIKFQDMKSYYYILVTRNDQGLGTYQYDNRNNEKYIEQAFSQISYRINPPVLWGSWPVLVDQSASNGFGSKPNNTENYGNYSIGRLTSIPSLLNSANSRVKQNSPSTLHDRFDKSDISTITILNAEWLAREDSVLQKLSTFYFAENLNSNKQHVGSVIASGFPIFTVYNYSQMIRYFQGESYISDNDPTPPPDDWSTNWDIYVRGANKPNIYITMKSDKVDEWLANSKNESGISKGDISVEWRNRVFSEYPIESYTLKDWQKTKYDNQLNTSYMELVQISYPSADDAPGNDPVWIPDAPPLTLIDFYGQWEFRLKYNKFTSTWCYAKIGVIGSPSVPDFTKMSNEGGQTNYGFNDSSTVTIHYDDYPPGYDPYPTPGKPSTPGIIGGDTLPTTPTDSALGLGLLTTTYLLTPAQCDELGSFLWNFDLFEKIKALNTSPLDNIVSIKIVPYAVSGSPREIVIGNVSTSINADKVGALPLYHVGSLEYAGRYDNFLDRGGDTTAHLFLPYIGFVPIDPIWFTDKKLDVYYAFDAVTGTCRAILVVDRIAVANYTSVCGIDIPLSMGSRAQQESAYVGASLGIMLAAAGAPVAGLAAGAGAVASIVQGDNKNQRTGGVSPITAQYETRMCYIVIESVDANYARSMGHDKGFPCNATYTLSQLKGYTQVVDTVDLSSIANATDQEKEEIRRLLVEGVYL